MNLGNLIEKVPYGSKQRFDCPYCHGKNTLSITKEGGMVLYNCYKANCEMPSGSRKLKMGSGELMKVLMSQSSLEGRTAAKEEFSLPTYLIHGIGSKKAFQMLLNSNCMEAYTAGMFKVAYDPKQDRLLYLIVNKDGKTVGAVGRALSGQKPKVLNYPKSEEVPFSCGKGNTAVIVEDCASACSIARIKDYTGIALCGTHLSFGHLIYLIENFDNVIIALDPDAYAKSFKMKNSIDYYATNVKVWRLNKELKDMSKEDIQNFIMRNNSTLIT